jgi:putative ATP-dependent endonuclease of the OLD family
MFLEKIHIKNFRGIEDLCLELDDICVLIGENNSGKSTIIDALRTCLTRSLTRKGMIFEEYDYHLPSSTSEPAKADPIEITLTFSEKDGKNWPDEISQLLEAAVQIDDADKQSVILRVKSGYDSSIGDFNTSYDFLDLSGNILIKAKNPRTIINLQQLAPTFYLSSLRDAAQEFKPRSQFWGPFVKALNIDAEAQAEIEAALHALNKKVLDKHTAFANIKEKLKKTADIIALGKDDPVSIEAVPSKIFDILSRTQVHLSSKTGSQIPITRHGNGTQSLAVILLFDAFLQSRLEDGYGDNATPILAMEEPEAHMHPSAAKAVGEMLQTLLGQKIITTHSGDLLAGVPLTKIRRICRKDGKISAHYIKAGSLSPDDLNKLDFKVRATRGSLLFARCWLLVEGETEAVLLPECARAMGIDLLAEGICCIEYSQIGIEKLIKFADQFCIQWIMVSDNDPEGKKYYASAKSQLNGRSEPDHLFTLTQDNIELFLCNEGFGSIYEATIAPQKSNSITATKGTSEYWNQVVLAQAKHVKPKNAISVAESMLLAKGVNVPQLFQNLISKARALAGSAA